MFRATCLAAAFTVAIAAAPAAFADGHSAPDGWQVYPTTHSYGDLVERVKQAAVDAPGVGVVTEAGPTQAVKKKLGKTIQGNRVIGVFGPGFAARVIGVSVDAMIEAPIRIMVTEEADGTATLRYKTPSHVFGPYLEEGGDTLAGVASDLDAVFAAIAEQATE